MLKTALAALVAFSTCCAVRADEDVVSASTPTIAAYDVYDSTPTWSIEVTTTKENGLEIH